MTCPGCGSTLFDGQKCAACGRLGTDTSPRLGSPRRPRAVTVLGSLALILLGVVLLLSLFADWIWDEKPVLLKWVGIGWGCLVLLGLLASLLFGKRDERIVALIVLAVVGVVVAILQRGEDRQANAAADELIAELSAKGEEIERRAAALPALAEKPSRADLLKHLLQSQQMLAEEREATDGFVRRVNELHARATSAKREELRQALGLFNRQVRAAAEKRQKWLDQVRRQVEALKKETRKE